MSRNLPVQLDRTKIDEYITELSRPRDYFSVVEQLANELKEPPDNPIKALKARLAPPAIPPDHIPAIQSYLEAEIAPKDVATPHHGR